MWGILVRLASVFWKKLSSLLMAGAVTVFTVEKSITLVKGAVVSVIVGLVLYNFYSWFTTEWNKFLTGQAYQELQRIASGGSPEISWIVVLGFVNRILPIDFAVNLFGLSIMVIGFFAIARFFSGVLTPWFTGMGVLNSGGKKKK